MNMTLQIDPEVVRKLYVVEKQTEAEVRKHLNEVYGLKLTPPKLKRALKKWGFTKNISRPQALALIRATANVDQPEDCSATSNCQPAPAKQLEHYLRRNKIGLEVTLPARLAPAEVWRVPERIFASTAALLAGSFESKYWTSAGSNLIIHSSDHQDFEKQCLHGFLSHIELAMLSVTSGKLAAARNHWAQAFESSDTLVRGHYHDHVPNTIQKINDLKDDGHPAVATQLQNHLAHTLPAQGAHGPTAEISRLLRLVHLDDMAELEERIMQHYAVTFERFLGVLHYNSFVMHMNLARRVLLRNADSRLEDHTPSLAFFDDMFGFHDVRSLDIIRLSIEICHHRRDYASIPDQAEELIERAAMKTEDVWQRLYFSIKGHYYLALAQREQLLHDIADANMYRAIELIADFSLVDENGMFNPELTVMENCLKDRPRMMPLMDDSTEV